MFHRQPDYAIQAAGESAAPGFGFHAKESQRLVAQRRGRFDLFALIQLTVHVLLRWHRRRRAARALGTITGKLLNDIGISAQEREAATEFFAEASGDYPSGR